MRLTQEQNDLLQHELTLCDRRLFDKDQEQRNNLIPDDFYSEVLSVDQIESARTKAYARKLIRLKIETIIRIYRKFGKFPDEEDYQNFTEELRVKLPERLLNKFDERCRNPFANVSNESIAAAVRSSLAMDLTNITADEFAPLTSFYLEGRAVKKPMDLESKKKRTVNEIENEFLIELYQQSNGEVFKAIDSESVYKALDFTDSESDIAIVRLKDRGLATFTFGKSYLTADGMEVVERLLADKEKSSEPTPSFAQSINVMGDYVQGNQAKINSSHQTIPKMPSAQWSTEAKIALVGVVITLIALVIAIAIPETRSFICEHSGLLCSKSN